MKTVFRKWPSRSVSRGASSTRVAGLVTPLEAEGTTLSSSPEATAYSPSRRHVLGMIAAVGFGVAGGIAYALERPGRALAAGARYGLDYAWAPHPSPSVMTAGGYSFVGRYLSNDATKNLTKSEAQSLIAAGIDIVCNWEAVADAALKGYSQGVTDAQTAQNQALACGMPADRPIYFSVDFDATAAQQSTLNDYFDGVAFVLGRNRTGAYAGYYPIQRLFDAGKITWAWQTYAWSGGNWDARAQVRQIQNGITVGGASCDKDQAMTSYFGQWGTSGAPTPSLAQHPPITTVVASSSSVDVFWKGSDGGLWHKWCSYGTWYGPENMGVGTIGSEPAAVSSSPGVMDLFWKGTDNNLWHKRFNGSAWLGHENLGAGPLNGKPVAVGQSSGTVDVFWMGTDNGMWHKWWNYGTWRGPEPMNVGQLGSVPVAASSTTGTIDVFWTGTDDALYHTWFSNSAWHPQQSLGFGPLGSAPVAIGHSGLNEVFWKGTDAALWHSWYDGTAWRGPLSRGGSIG